MMTTKIHHYTFFAITAILIIVHTACKKQDQNQIQNTANNKSLTGTIVFGTGEEVASTVLGSNTSSLLFRGKDPSWTPDGRIIYDIWGEYTANQDEQINIASTNGTGVQTLVDLGQYNSGLYANPKMSRDGKYVSFNFFDSKTGQPVGLKIYQINGTLVYTAKNLWDGSWAPDGSLVAAGTVYALHSFGPETYGTPGLFTISSDFKQTTAIGTGLTLPWYPCVSPDGKKIAFSMNNHIWTINMDGSGLTQVTTGPNIETYSCWSPDGTMIAAVSTGNLSFEGLAMVSSRPANPVTVSQGESVWLKDNTNSNGSLSPTGNVSWK